MIDDVILYKHQQLSLISMSFNRKVFFMNLHNLFAHPLHIRDVLLPFSQFFEILGTEFSERIFSNKSLKTFVTESSKHIKYVLE